MAPVVQKPSRRTLPAPPKIVVLMEAILRCDEADLPAILTSFYVWNFPKGDLFQWVDVLNRFDSILEVLCDRYHLHGVQECNFSAQDQLLLKAILKFTVFLLDHCANRGLYASASYVDQLINTTDIEVLEQVAQLALRLAQRVSDQRNGRVNYPLSQDRLWDLAASLQLDDNASSIPMTSLLAKSATLADQYPCLQFSYFRTLADTAAESQTTVESSSENKKQGNLPTDSPFSPQFSRSQVSQYISILDQKQVEGVVTIRIPREHIQSRSLEQLYNDALKETRLPRSYRYKFMLRLRLHKHLNDAESLQRLVNIRILALASAAHVATEPVLQSRLSVLESTLLGQLAQLTHSEHDHYQSVMAASLWALEAIAHHRPRLVEVLNVLGASIDHGMLMYGLRKTLTDICNGLLPQSTDVIDAQISILHYLCTTSMAGSMLCSAGLIQLLLQFVSNCQSGSLRVLVKVSGLLDHLVYGYPQAFSIFCESQGVKVIVDRINHEVQKNVSNSAVFLSQKVLNKTDYAMTHESFSFLKTLLKFILHMLMCSGTGEGRRMLMESSIFAAMKIIYENVDVFGSSVFASTTNIMAAFIHHEPSTYQVLHEAQLPQLFLKSVSDTILPAADVLTSLPNAFGAICLNSAGLDLFNSLSPIPNFMKIFTSRKHCEILRESDLAGILGSTVDELVRHQPSLREPVQHGISKVIEEISSLGNSTPPVASTASRFASCEDQSLLLNSSSSSETTYVDEDSISCPIAVLFVDIISRFLEGYLHNMHHTDHFIASNGVDSLLDFYELQCLPYDFTKSHPAHSLSHVVRLLVESDSRVLIASVFGRMRAVLDKLSETRTLDEAESFFGPYLAGNVPCEVGSQLVQNLQIIHNLIILISELYTAPMNRSLTSTSLSQPFAASGEHIQMLQDLGSFHRVLIWEDVKLADTLTPSWLSATRSKDGNSPSDSSEEDVIDGLTPEEVTSSKFRDLKMVRFFLNQIPSCITPFFQGLTRVLSSHRRGENQSHRLLLFKVAPLISRVLEKHIEFLPPNQASTNCKQSYTLLALTFWQKIICDDRSNTHVMTSVLLDLDRGLDLLGHVMDKAWQDLADLKAVIRSGQQDAKNSAVDLAAQEVRLSGILQITLDLWSKMTSERSFLGSSQTIYLDSKDRHKDRPGYFEPKSFLRHLQLKIVPIIAGVWQQPRFDNASVGIVRSALRILTQCLIEGADAEEMTPYIPNDFERFSNGDARGASKATSIPTHKISMTDLRSMINGVAAAQSLEHLAAYGPEIVFETADLLTRLINLDPASTSWAQDVLGIFLGTLESMVDTVDEPTNSVQFKAVGHLLVNLFANVSIAELFREDLDDALETLISIAESVQSTSELASDVTCVTNLLMCCDTILAHQQSSSLDRLAHADKDLVRTEAKAVDNVPQIDRLFILCERCLDFAHTKLAVLSILRVLVRLTCRASNLSRTITTQFVQKLIDVVRKIIVDCDQNMKITLILFLRHLVESRDVLKQGFTKSILRTLKNESTAVTDLDTYVKRLLPMALRDIDLFLSTSEDLCHFTKQNAAGQSDIIELKSSSPTHEPDMEIDEPLTLPAQSLAPSDLLGFLLGQLVECRESYIAEMNEMSKVAQEVQFVPKDHMAYMYMCMLLQFLLELTASHEQCKSEFFTGANIIVNATGGTTWQGYSSPLRWFIVEMIGLLPSQIDMSKSTAAARKIHLHVAKWSKWIVTTLCLSEGPKEGDKDFWRVHLLDYLYEDIKTALYSDLPIGARYSQLIAYAGVLDRLVTHPSDGFEPSAAMLPDEVEERMAKLMLEKNFVGILSQVIAELDHKFPLSQEVVRCILRPMKVLTKMALRLPDLASPIASTHGQISEIENAEAFIEPETEITTAPLENREDTPDLYRNSALGMFEADMRESDEDSYDSDDDDEEMVCISYDEMEFDADGSETGSAVSDEELDMNREDSFGHHDIEIIVDDDDDGDDDSLDSSGSSGSGSESDGSSGEDSFSDDFDILGATADESDWQDEGNAIENADNLSMPDVQHSEAAQGVRRLPRFMSDGAAFVLEDVTGRSHAEPLNEPLLHDENEEDSDEESAILASAEDIPAGDEESVGDELWDWSAGTEEDNFGNEIPANIANRLWASLASGSPQGQLLRRPYHGIQILRHSGTGNMLRGSTNHVRSGVSNPLLSRPNTSSSESTPTMQRNQFGHWIESIEALIGGGAVQLIGDIMQRPSDGAQSHETALPIQIQVNQHSQDGTSHSQLDIIHPNRRLQEREARRPSPEDASHFECTLSLRRYEDEALLRFPFGHAKHHEIVSKALSTLLRPTDDTLSTESVGQENPAISETDAPMATDPSMESEPASSAPMDVDSNIVQEQQTTDNHIASSDFPRQLITLRGHTVDITGLGIDSDFLEALPEDMQAEVLTQHLRERRANSRDISQSTPELSPEFLEALPVEIRAELLQQEAADRRRLDRLNRQAQVAGRTGNMVSAGGTGPFVPQDPSLYHGNSAVDGHVPVLPNSGSLQPSRTTGAIDFSDITTRTTQLMVPSQIPLASSNKRETVQLLERQGIAAILQLLFYPANYLRSSLHDILLHLCANRTSRIEILSQLLALFHDSTLESASIEKSWSALTRRARSVPFSDSPQKSPKKSLPASTTQGLVSSSALMLQCLRAFSYLMRFNQQVPSFFLLELEVIRKSAKSKGKSRELVAKSSKFPLNDLMLPLGKDFVLQDVESLELISSVISSTTRPLLLLRKPVAGATPKQTDDASSTTDKSQTDDAPVITDKSQIAINPARANKRELVPPEVPASNLKLIINLVTADACNGKTFQHTLASIHHLSALDGAKAIIAEELNTQGQNFVPQMQEDLVKLYQELTAVQKADDLPRNVMAHFSSSNSVQTKFLRLLKTIDHLEYEVAQKLSMREGSEILQSTDQSWLKTVVESPIWNALGRCLTIIQDRPKLESVATLLLPVIEALMVVCRHSSETQVYSPRSIIQSDSDKSSRLFLEFTDQHKIILNQMVRNSPSLMSGSFALLTRNPKVLDFDNKRNYFHRKVRDKGSDRVHFAPIQLNVRRDAVFLDSYKDLHFKTGNEIKYSKLNIRFVGEEGVDAGGVSREWFQVLARQMFDPNYALFVPVNADKNTFHPNKTSGINPEHLLFFKFIGRIVGKALYDGRLLDCHFSRPIYCKMLEKNVSLKDMETLDLEYYKSLVWMLNNDITDVIAETFSVERDDFGEVTIIDLIPGGRNVAVTEENKQDYVARVTEYRLLNSVSDQLTQFMVGFNEIIPASLISIFNEQELELLISGLPDIDTDDWRNNTEYQNYTTSDPQIQWFWRALRSFDDEQRARLLQFCTGSSRLPIEGFAHLEGMHGVQKFNIHRDYSKGVRLPQSHTCFNQLDLPEYENYESLRSSLLTAISEGNEGFGFA